MRSMTDDGGKRTPMCIFKWKTRQCMCHAHKAQWGRAYGNGVRPPPSSVVPEGQSK